MNILLDNELGGNKVSYSYLLRKYIKDSNLSLNEIAEKLIPYGFNMDKAYLSRLQNNKVGPASEELNKALAEITGGDSDQLIKARYYEKAPEAVKQILENTVNFNTFLKSDESYWKERASKAENELSRLKKQLINLTNTFHEEVKNDM